MSELTEISRRRFLTSSAQAGGLLLSLQLLPVAHALADTGKAKQLMAGVFVAIDDAGIVTITCHRSEMGQHIRSSIAQIVADELEADWDKVVIAQATGDAKFGEQNTDGSRSVRRNFTRLRQAGAAARLLLRQAAAKSWSVSLQECEAKNHQVVHIPSGRKLAYGELVSVASGLSLSDLDTLVLKSRKDWRYIGKSIPDKDVGNVVQGKSIFGFDVQLPDMLVAVIARPPVLFGKVKHLDDTAARQIDGVVDVITLPALSPPAVFTPLGGVAVLAKHSWAALKGRDALKIDWLHGDNASYESGAYGQTLLETARKSGETVRDQGDIESALANASKRVVAEYTTPHLAHAPMEPPVATAKVDKERAEIWASVQAPQKARSEVAKALGMELEQVTINVTLLGGGFGRKSKPDFIVEAALLSKAAGVPVKVMWSREDEIKHGYYHTVSAQRVEGGLDENGNTIAWLQRTVFPTIVSTFNSAATIGSANEMRMGFVDNPFDIPDMRLEKGQAKAHVRIGWLRSVANVYHAFATQSFAHELAHAAGRDPKDYLLQLIGKARHIDLAKAGVEYDNYGDPFDVYPVDTGRLSNVVRHVAEKAGWNTRVSEKRSLGIAAHRSFLSYVATIVEVKIDKDGSWRIPTVHVAIDAGTVVNPDHVRAQVEGGCIYGLSCALGKITATDGVIDQNNFNDYPVTRISQAPKSIQVHIIESDAAPAGVGEPPTPPFMPALCNAIFEARGVRVRDLPVPLKIVT